LRSKCGFGDTYAVRRPCYKRAGSIGRSIEGNKRALRMKFKLLAGAALAAVFAATGAAAQVGWYGAVDLGYHWPETTSFDTTSGASVDLRTQDDWAGFGRLGYQL